ncbi:hypothetical protein DYB30_007437 [Aphanomyces astaci]|uniref:Uncharacterized protein n=1 Tax=Aphanomyces astaci TaxID=112090 RepID=A0A397DP87_APHAT|nr:hypothetical protein DYB36_001660 [Aphanomyces astaci]RHY65666.1 hypothetical protein DYB30_007437 [Aphanomyces astaci]RHY69219.1 hypothetical protein DYB38_007108 [Aphanomyces astaci]
MRILVRYNACFLDAYPSLLEEANVTDDATNTKYIIILGSVIAGVVCIVLAAVLVRRRFQRASESDKSLYVDTQRGSMAFMESTRQSSVPVLQSNSRVYGKSHLLPPPTNSTPMQRSQSRRDQSSQEPMYRLSSIHHAPPDSFNQPTNMTRISEAENSDGSSATTTSDVPGGFATDVRGTDDLCRFTQASDQYSEGTYDDDYGNGSRFPSDMSHETDWSIGSKGAENPGPTLAATEWGAPPPSQDHRTTDDLLYSGRSLISIDDSSVRGSSDAWLDSSRFNAIVSSDVHTF